MSINSLYLQSVIYSRAVNFLQRLQAETQASHLTLEGRLPFGQADLTPEKYAQVLQAFSAVVPALEARLATLPISDAFDLPSRFRREALLADMQALGVAPLPALHSWDDLTPAQGLGALYVLEGSRLGGAIIARELRALNLTPEHGAAYFAPDPQLGGRWKAFCAALEEQVAAEQGAGTQADDIVRGAEQTFQAFLDAWQSVTATGTTINELPRIGVDRYSVSPL